MNKLKTTIRIGELDTILRTISRLYQEHFNSVGHDEILSIIIVELKEISQKMNLAIKRSKVENNFDLILIARDNSLREFAKALDSYAGIPIAEKQEKAKYLLNIYKKYRPTILKERQAIQSSSIESLLTDLSAEKAKNAIEELEGISNKVVQIRKAQDDYDKAIDNKTTEKAKKEENATYYRKPAFFVINEKLRSYVKVLRLIKPEIYETFAKELEIEIDKANSKGTRK